MKIPSPRNIKKEVLVFFIILATINIAAGFSDNIYGNYFKEAYQISTVQRGFIEFPRELPGFLAAFLIAGLSFLGDIRLAILAQMLCFLGLIILGLFTPPFALMLVFLFINSMGTHLFLPLSDGIGLSLIEEPQKVGKRMGQFNGVKTLFLMLSSAVVFVGFRFGWFSFNTPIKWVFVYGAIFFIISFSLFLYLQKILGKKEIVRKKSSFLFRKEYKYYYILAILTGVQKQIMLVYAPWVLIELLGKKADTVALLGILGAFAGVFFMPAIGRWIDRFGVKKMLYFDALSFIFVYVAYGVLSGAISSGALPQTGLPVLLIFLVYIFDKMSMQMGMIRVLYLNKIAVHPEEVTRTLSTGISMDHVFSILFAYIYGFVWTSWGPQYVFYITAAFSLINLAVAAVVKVDRPVMQPDKASGEG